MNTIQHDKLVANAECTRPVEELLKALQPLDEERKEQRTEALKKLVLLLKMWARMVVYQQGQPDKVVTQKHLKLVPFGSFRYDDTSKDSDIDLLCITSKYITRKHFFHDLCRLFEGMKEVEGFTVIMAAVVPIIKMKFRGVAMDICFTQLACKDVPTKLTLDYIATMNMDQMDDKSIASLNGYIMTAFLQELMPNFRTFTTTLNAIKLWAKRHGVYSAMLGFLGGSSWSLLVAKICQLYPDATPTALTSIFFHFYAAWDWTLPIELDTSNSPHYPPPPNPWVIPTDYSRDVMQIMTPLNPSTNSSRNVSHSALHILRNEFRKAAKITESQQWDALFGENERDFFSRYPLYVQVVVGALRDQGEEALRKWEGWTKSRISGLVKSLEQQEGVEFAHLNTHQYQRNLSVTEPECTVLFIGLSMDDKHPHPVPRATTNQFVRNVTGWREFDPQRMGVEVQFFEYGRIPSWVV